ncbi:MAG: PIG-L family deacetylase [Pseudomonadota bacterium]
MPTSDQTRITEDRARPRIMELWWALQPLRSVIRFMNTGAHPDDEITDLLAALAFGEGINLSYACSTRGEGGQNDIGTEAGVALGALRTREMERACDVLGMRMYWHSTAPDDAITDFGFSKSGVETLGKWGHDRTLARFVEIVRTDRPDIICPTFLDVPGQHGHHRAMTQAAHEVMAAAADPAFPSNLPPWQVKKMYLPAWSGAGQAYDDDEPPPRATLTVESGLGDPASGWSWGRIGQQSRAYHRTQGMGRWVRADDPGRDWPLHLVEAHVDGPDVALASGLAVDLRALGQLAEAIAGPLGAAQDGIHAALAAYPDFDAVAGALAGTLGHVRAARAACPEAVAGEVIHRLDAKEVQLSHALRHAIGFEARARLEDTWLAPGMTTRFETEIGWERADSVGLRFELPVGWASDNGVFALAEDAVLTDPYRSEYDPLVPPAPSIKVNMDVHGIEATCLLPLENPPVATPGNSGALDPQAVLLNHARPGREVRISLSELRPEGADAALDVPEGWTAARTETGFKVTLPEAAPEGLHALHLTIEGTPAQTVRRIAYDHVDPTALYTPAVVRVRVLDVAVPDVRVGYIGGGNDRVGHWLGAVGADVRDLTDAEIASEQALSGYDTLVIGIFAMRFRAGLAEAMPRIDAWVAAGGTLLTLYHRPWDNWDPGTIPPRRLEIGQPSLRWRVTDETAAVTHLAEHPILSGPNPIGPEDWDGWVKERGLYFAKCWDDAYTPLLSMADPEEEPHHGALLVGDIGAGRHIHTSLILHHQMEHLVPGAFRLMANMIARRG